MAWGVAAMAWGVARGFESWTGWLLGSRWRCGLEVKTRGGGWSLRPRLADGRAQLSRYPGPTETLSARPTASRPAACCDPRPGDYPQLASIRAELDRRIDPVADLLQVRLLTPIACARLYPAEHFVLLHAPCAQSIGGVPHRNSLRHNALTLSSKSKSSSTRAP